LSSAFSQIEPPGRYLSGEPPVEMKEVHERHPDEFQESNSDYYTTGILPYDACARMPRVDELIFDQDLNSQALSQVDKSNIARLLHLLSEESPRDFSQLIVSFERALQLNICRGSLGKFLFEYYVFFK
jgi:hypothetical protein